MNHKADPHWQSYQTIATDHSDLQHDIMNHTAIVHGTRAIKDTIAFLDARPRPIPLNLAEVGSALNFGRNHYELEAVLGAALWQTDFMLWTMSLDVHRVHIQLGIGFGFAPWQPIAYKGLPAKVNPPFYAHLLVADFIGRSSNFEVRNVDLDRDTLSAYAGYEGGALKKMAIVNLEKWGAGDDPHDRPSYDIEINVPLDISAATIRRLTSLTGATETDSRKITWGGYSWSRESNGKAEKMSTGQDVVRRVVDGVFTVTVKASQAVVIYLQ